MRLITSILLSAFSFYSCVAQDDADKKRKPIDTDNINAFIDVSYMNLSALGTNYISEATSLNAGASFKAGIFVYDRLYIGGALGFASLSVTDVSLIGNANRATIGVSNILAGYMLNVNDRFSINADVGYGWINYTFKLNALRGTDVEADDTGNFIIFNTALEYRLTKDLGIMVGAAYQNNSMDIKTAAAIQPLFEKSEFLIFQVGLRFSIR